MSWSFRALEVEAVTRDRSGIYEINGAILYAEVAGTGAPLVFVHSGITDSGMWDDQWSPFAARFRMLRYDLRGFGRSSIPPAAYAHHDDLAALLNVLDFPEAVVIGASFGGEVALAFALEYPERVSALVLVGTLAGKGPETSGELRAGWDAMEAALDRGDIDRAVEIELGMWVDGPSRSAGEVDPDVRERVRVMDTALLHRAAEQELAEERELDPPLRDRLEAIAVPTLVLAGALDMPDTHTSSELLAARIPNATHIVIPESAHLPSMEQPEVFARLVIDFLEEQVP